MDGDGLHTVMRDTAQSLGGQMVLFLRMDPGRIKILHYVKIKISMI